MPAALLCMQGAPGAGVAEANVIEAARAQKGGRIPVVAALTDELSAAGAAACLRAGADGVALSHSLLPHAAACSDAGPHDNSVSIIFSQCTVHSGHAALLDILSASVYAARWLKIERAH